jgi:hypothetical protein
MDTFRQGDVLLIKVDELPADAEQVKRDAGRIILAYGETTGHKHAIKAPQVKMIVTTNGERFLSSTTGFSLNHEEHATVKVPTGNFQVIIQREYSPTELRTIVD